MSTDTATSTAVAADASPIDLAREAEGSLWDIGIVLSVGALGAWYLSRMFFGKKKKGCGSCG